MSANLSKAQEMESKYEENQPVETAQNVAPAEDFACELNQPCWSVVTYKSIAVSYLTYDEAAQWSADLKKEGVSGLCVITDDAASRITD